MTDLEILDKALESLLQTYKLMLYAHPQEEEELLVFIDDLLTYILRFSNWIEVQKLLIEAE